MNKTLLLLSILFISLVAEAQKIPSKKKILKPLRVANAYFMNKWPDPGKSIITNRERPSNIWTRGVYYEGLMALHSIDPKKSYYDYAVDWGAKHNWNMRNGIATRNADDQCCGQTYIDLYMIDKKEERIRNIKACIDNMVKSDKADDWNWIDALQMAMPVFVKLGGALPGHILFQKNVRPVQLRQIQAWGQGSVQSG